MKSFSGYDEAKKEAQATASAKLPVGAYVCKVQDVRLEEFDWGSRLVIAYDVIEGEFKDFFKKQFEENTSEDKKWKGKTAIYVPKDDGSEKDKITKKSFASWMDAFEKSNSGYSWDWDEKKLKNKVIGIVYGETGTVIEGKEVKFTEARFGVDAQLVRDGKAPSAKFKAKNGFGGNGSDGSGSGSSDEFMNVPAGQKEDIPF